MAVTDNGVYKNILKYELELFKEKVGYDNLVKQMKDDMKEKGYTYSKKDNK